MKNKILKKLSLVLAKQYTSIGGQAVIEGVMMRSPNAFVIAVRKANGTIRLRRDQWYGLSEKLSFFKKPFFRGVLMMVEAMVNGVVSLNYSANEAMEDELIEKAKKKGKDLKDVKQSEDIDWQTYLTIGFSFIMGMGLFVFAPHALTAGLAHLLDTSWDLDSFTFHAVDGSIKAMIFLLYIWLIGFMPDVKRVFQYHGAEHKSISTFESGQDLTVENARKFTTLHPRCGTSFLFFLIFISIVLFSAIFTLLPIPTNLPKLLQHLVAICFKMVLMFPIAGISYEVIKWAGKNPNKMVCKVVSQPGMWLQKLTTKEPDDEQLEVALASIKTALFLEKKYNLKDSKDKILTREVIDIASLNEIDDMGGELSEFLEG